MQRHSWQTVESANFCSVVPEIRSFDFAEQSAEKSKVDWWTAGILLFELLSPAAEIVLAEELQALRSQVLRKEPGLRLPIG